MPRINFELLVGAALFVSVACSGPWVVIAGMAWAWHTQGIALGDVTREGVRRAVFRGGFVGGLLVNVVIQGIAGLSVWSAVSGFENLDDSGDRLLFRLLVPVAAPFAIGLVGVVARAWLIGLSVRLLWPWLARLRTD